MYLNLYSSLKVSVVHPIQNETLTKEFCWINTLKQKFGSNFINQGLTPAEEETKKKKNQNY